VGYSRTEDPREDRKAAERLIARYERKIAELRRTVAFMREEHKIGEHRPVTLWSCIKAVLVAAEQAQVTVSEIVSRIEASDTKPQGDRDVTAVTKSLWGHRKDPCLHKHDLGGGSVAYSWTPKAPRRASLSVHEAPTTSKPGADDPLRDAGRPPR
jgi:hypothetical protein